MKPWWRRWGWPIAKGLLALAILVGVGRQFYRDLQHLNLAHLQINLDWVILSGLLYLIALGFSAGYWYRLLWIFGEKPSWFRAVRAYYIGHLGKYVPGKAWALIMRGSLVSGPEVRFGVAVITSFYEVLTTMATGALLAAVVFAIHPPEINNLRWPPWLTGLILLGLIGIPLLPGVFNLLVQRMARRFQTIDSFKVPRMQGKTLAEGILETGLGWCCMGASVWSMLAAVLPNVPELTPDVLAQCIASIGLAYVAGFLAIIMPSGVGVREYFLHHLLSFAGPVPLIAVAVVLLRLVWTAAELLVAALIIWRKGHKKENIGLVEPPQPAPRNHP